MNLSKDDSTIDAFANLLRSLRLTRRKFKKSKQFVRVRRKALTNGQRRHVLSKTAGRCHICGGMIVDNVWNADHVLAHSSGGDHSIDNYLAAHIICNNYRWDYSAEEIQQILKIGVWTRTQIEHKTKVGRQIASRYLVHENARQRRRKARPPAS